MSNGVRLSYGSQRCGCSDSVVQLQLQTPPRPPPAPPGSADLGGLGNAVHGAVAVEAPMTRADIVDARTHAASCHELWSTQKSCDRGYEVRNVRKSVITGMDF